MFRKVRVREDAGGVECLLRSPQVADQASWAIHLNLTKYLILFQAIFSGYRKIYSHTADPPSPAIWESPQLYQLKKDRQFLAS